MNYKIILFFVALIFLGSCKKKYTCNCLSGPLPTNNYASYTVKEKSKFDALINCGKQYEASGKTNGIGGFNCDVY